MKDHDLRPNHASDQKVAENRTPFFPGCKISPHNSKVSIDQNYESSNKQRCNRNSQNIGLIWPNHGPNMDPKI